MADSTTVAEVLHANFAAVPFTECVEMAQILEEVDLIK